MAEMVVPDARTTLCSMISGWARPKPRGAMGSSAAPPTCRRRAPRRRKAGLAAVAQDRRAHHRAGGDRRAGAHRVREADQEAEPVHQALQPARGGAEPLTHRLVRDQHRGLRPGHRPHRRQHADGVRQVVHALERGQQVVRPGARAQRAGVGQHDAHPVGEPGGRDVAAGRLHAGRVDVEGVDGRRREGAGQADRGPREAAAHVGDPGRRRAQLPGRPACDDPPEGRTERCG
jgi:hypothetical protein